jgi:hypothetical protein
MAGEDSDGDHTEDLYDVTEGEHRLAGGNA